MGTFTLNVQYLFTSLIMVLKKLANIFRIFTISGFVSVLCCQILVQEAPKTR